MNPRASFACLVAFVAALGAGLWHLFDLRFTAGDVYPPGSSLRADAPGTRALHDSLALLPDRTVSRWLLPVSSLRGGAGTTLFLLSVNPAEPWLGTRDRDALKNLLVNGGRIVVTLDSNPSDTNASRTPKPGPSSRAGAESLRDILGLVPTQPISGLESNSPAPVALRAQDAPASLPQKITWRGDAFREVSAPWTVLYEVAGAPVMLERPFGRGMLVVLASNDLLSNAALRHDRRPALLSWLVGPADRVIFEETHLGTRMDPGILTLVRRYGLGGVLAGGVLVAGLATWRGVSGLVPRLPAPPPGDRVVVTGRDTSAGFTHLLRRSVPREDLIALCVAEWRRSAPKDRPDLLRKAAELQDLANLDAALPPRERDPVATYRRMAQLLSRP